MPIINSRKTKEVENMKFKINSCLVKEINEYCKWASVGDIGLFFEQAAEFILKKDTEWKKHNKTRLTKKQCV